MINMSKKENQKKQKQDQNKKNNKIILELEQKIEKLKENIEQEKEAKLKTLADMDNLRKEMEKKQNDIVKFGNLNILRSIIEVVDDFERMIEEIKDKKTKVDFDNINPIVDKLKGILQDKGLDEIKVNIGEKFDPSRMQGIGTVKVEDENEVNKVKHIAEKGYKLKDGDVVVRHARVIVGKHE